MGSMLPYYKSTMDPLMVILPRFFAKNLWILPIKTRDSNKNGGDIFLGSSWDTYPLVNIQKTIERSTLVKSPSTDPWCCYIW